MRRIRFESEDGPRWGELEGESVHLLSGMTGERTGETVAFAGLPLLAPCEPRTIVCVGKNYADHVREMGGSELPKEPGLFLKGLNALARPGDPMPYPAWTENLQYEGELAAVIGKRLHRVKRAAALEHVLGYAVAIDVTARDKQRADLQWTRGKSADGFCLLGAWLETELDPSALAVQTRVNGELKQDGNTRDFIFDLPTVLAYVSAFMTLEPGDLVLTGTPEGVGPVAVGDTVEVTVEGIGELRARVERA